MNFELAGPIIALGLSCLGSAIGCGIAGMASHGVMSRVEEGHGKFITLSAMPASQAIYGIVLLFLMKSALDENRLGALDGVIIGFMVGLAILFAAVYKGMAAASAIQATAKQPSVFAKTFISIGVIEAFSLFAFVFALVLIS